MFNEIKNKRFNVLNFLFTGTLLLHSATFFIFTLEKNILYSNQKILSKNIYLNNFNIEYLNFRNFNYLLDFGAYIPISIIIFTFSYIGSKSKLSFKTLTLSVFYFILISFIRTSIFEIFLFVFAALFFYFFVNKDENIQNLFLKYFFCYLLILIAQRRIFINAYALSDFNFNFQGEVVVALIASFFYFVFISKKQIIQVFVISFILSLVLNPISYAGGLYCCGSSSYEINEDNLVITGYQWENFGVQEESPRAGDYFTIESLSALENPYDNKSTTYPPFSLVLTKTIDTLGNQINYFDIKGLNYALFLLLVLITFIYAFNKIQKISVLKNFIILGSFILSSYLLIDQYILLNLALKSFLLFLFYKVNLGLRISQSNYSFFLTALSFPLIYSVERGNIDTIIFPLVILFLILIINERYYFASLILSILGSLKIFPLVLVLLFVNKKNYIFSIFTLIQTFFITQASFLIYNLKFDGYRNLINNYIYVNDFVFTSNPINYSSYSSSFTSFVKQYMSFLNLGFVYGETSVNGFYDVKSSFGIWTTMWMLPRLKLLLILGLIFFCLIYVYRFRTISSLEFTIMLTIVFLIFIDLNPSYRFSIIIVLLLIYTSISKLDLKIPILLLLLPLDLFYFPTHLTIVNSSALIYYPVLIYLFKKVRNKKTNINFLKI